MVVKRPWPTPDGYPALARMCVELSEVPRLLSQRRAIVLERVARGAGTTYWYEVSGPDVLVELAERLGPGSRVSFYFDDRLRFRAVSESFIDDYLAWGPEAVVGLRTEDDLVLEVGFWTGLADLTEFLGPQYSTLEDVLLGAYPSDDDDGVDAVTIVLPDADGLVRAHPY
jgi:hypothetical protein